MTQKDFNFLEKDQNNKLSVLLLADSFFYGIYNMINGLVAHRSFENLRYSIDETIEKIAKDENLKIPFSSVNIACISNHSYFTETKNIETINKFPGLELKNSYVEKLPWGEISNYFGITRHQENLIALLFGEGNYQIHSPAFLLNHRFSIKDGQFIHIHKEDNFVIIYVQQDGRPIFYNTFHVENENNVLYFALAAAKSTKLNLANDSLSLSGWIESNSKMRETLSAYFGKVSMADDSSFKLHSNVSEELKAHYYFMHFLNIL